MDKILSDIRQLILDADEDQVLEFVEMVMVQNKQLMAENHQLLLQCEKFMEDFEPEPEPEYKGTEKIEYQEGVSLMEGQEASE